MRGILIKRGAENEEKVLFGKSVVNTERDGCIGTFKMEANDKQTNKRRTSAAET